jgi:hypothetical protein
MTPLTANLPLTCLLHACTPDFETGPNPNLSTQLFCQHTCQARQACPCTRGLHTRHHWRRFCAPDHASGPPSIHPVDEQQKHHNMVSGLAFEPAEPAMALPTQLWSALQQCCQDPIMCGVNICVGFFNMMTCICVGALQQLLPYTWQAIQPQLPHTVCCALHAARLLSLPLCADGCFGCLCRSTPTWYLLPSGASKVPTPCMKPLLHSPAHHSQQVQHHIQFFVRRHACALSAHACLDVPVIE